MILKPIIIVSGEPYSTFLEIFFKTLKDKRIKNYKTPILIIGSHSLIVRQMKKLKYSLKIKLINIDKHNLNQLDKNYINILNVDFHFKKTFDKISSKSKTYISKCFKLALRLMSEDKGLALINGPISKKHFLNKKFLGITEYISHNTLNNGNEVMLIFNNKLAVCPITTHQSLKRVAKNITIKKIIQKINTISIFYKKHLNKKIKLAVCGLNPHCETNEKFSEEDTIIKPAIKILNKNKINVKGPFAADTLFLNKNIKKYDVIIGMYHDQVLTPIKTLFGFNAINITLGLPFIRISPDHGPNSKMLGKNKSIPESLIQSLLFLKKIRAN